MYVKGWINVDLNRNNIETAVTNMTKQRMLWKTLINDLTFRMAQHTSAEVTVGYNTIRFKEKDRNLIKKIVKNWYYTYLPKVCWKMYIKENLSRYPHFGVEKPFKPNDSLILQWISERPVARISKWSHLILCPVEVIGSAMADAWQLGLRRSWRSSDTARHTHAQTQD